MKSIFIRSSAKLAADPDYYRKKYERFAKKHEEAMEKAGRNLDVQPADEPPELTRQIDDFGAKRMHYLNRYYASLAMRSSDTRR